MEYIDNEENNDVNTDVNIKISQIEDFNYFILNDDNECYRAIYFEIESQLKWNNIKIEINFEKLKKLYLREIIENLKKIDENIYMSQRNKKFIEKQFKILNKFDF